MRTEKYWGWYEILNEEPHLIVKKVFLNPDSISPLQMETHVTKHWTLIEGSGSVCLGKPDKSTWQTIAGSTWKVHDKMMHQISSSKDGLLYIEIICGILLTTIRLYMRYNQWYILTGMSLKDL